MRLLLLGTGGYHPNERRHTACYFLPELGLLLDAGTAMFRVQEHLQTPTLDIVLTHAHLDHVIGLTYLHGIEHHGQPAGVSVHAERKTLEAVQTSLLAPALFPVPPELEYHALPDAMIHPSGAQLRFFTQDHPGGSLGIRIDHEDKSLGYVTDTTGLDAAGQAILEGVDLLLHEAYFTETQRDLATLTGHATAADAARAAVACNASRLLLVHRDPHATDDQAALAEAAAIFGQVACAEDGQEIVV